MACAETQLVFVDFDTHTSIDNVYVVNSISHNISAGKFETQLKLHPHDAYARYRAPIQAIGQAIATIEDLQKTAERQNTASGGGGGSAPERPPDATQADQEQAADA